MICREGEVKGGRMELKRMGGESNQNALYKCIKLSKKNLINDKRNRNLKYNTVLHT